MYQQYFLIKIKIFPDFNHMFAHVHVCDSENKAFIAMKLNNGNASGSSKENDVTMIKHL